MLLNLSRQEDLLTQGQPPANRVLENPGQGRQAEMQPGTAQANSPAAATVDPLVTLALQRVIARRVYELMKQELLITHERRGPGR
jgi:hypothetical protein